MYEAVEIESALRQSTCFAGLPDAPLRALARVARLQRLKRGDVLFMEGRRGTGMFLLVSGRVRLYRTDADGQETTLRLVAPGDSFAEVVLFESDRFPVTADCLEAGAVVKLPRREVTALLEAPAFRTSFLAFLMRRLRELALRVQQMSNPDMEARLVDFLRANFGGGGVREVAMTKREVAAALGMAPETLSRVLKRLREAGVLEWKRGRLQWGGGR